MTLPTNRPECEAVQTLIPEYALGALPQTEADSVTNHVRACLLCRRELRAYERVVDGLLVSPAPAAPSPLLRARVMQGAGIAPAPARREGFRLSAWLGSALSGVGLVPRLSPAVAALALVLAVAGGYQSFQLQSDLRRVQVENQTLASEMASNRSVIADALRPGATVWQFRGTDSAPSARASLYCNPNGQTGVLAVENLQPLPAGEAYQLWLIRDGQRASGGMLTVDASGRGVLTVLAPEPLGDYQSVGMTVEPAAGSPGPTGQRVLSGQIYTPQAY